MQARFLFLILVSSVPGWVRADVISLRADNWCPYNCAPGSDKPGYLIEIAQRVFREAGHTVDYQKINWARAISETRKGKFNAIVGAAKSDAEDFVFPEESMGFAIGCFYTKPGMEWKYENPESLAKLKIGVIKDYSYSATMDAYITKHRQDTSRVEVVAGEDALLLNLKKLKMGRITAIFENDYVMNYTLSAHKGEFDVKQSGCIDNDPIYIAFSPNHPQSRAYAKLLSTGVASLRKSGALKEILARYGLNNWQ